jgi:hypothetical protein
VIAARKTRAQGHSSCTLKNNLRWPAAPSMAAHLRSKACTAAQCTMLLCGIYATEYDAAQVQLLPLPLGCLALLGRLAFLLSCQAVTVAVTVHATNPFLQGVSARNQVIMVQQCQAFAAGGGSVEASIILDPNMVT